MTPETTRALARISRRFYRTRGEAFDATRRGPGPGFAWLGRALPAPPARTLDLGCGNGRLGAFLAKRFGPERGWLGVDASPALLASAGARPDLPRRARTRALDLLDAAAPLPGGSFDLVALIAVLHHVPGEAARADLLARAAARVAQGGLLAATFWRFGEAPHLAARALPFAGTGVDAADVEPGDALLPFGGDGRVPRYCHAFAREEIDRLARAPGLPVHARCEAPEAGSHDTFILWQRPAASAERPDEWPSDGSPECPAGAPR